MSTTRISDWAPANETSYDLYVERTNFDGFSLGTIGYGVQLTIAFMCCQALFKLRRRQPRYSYALLTYVVVIFILATLGNAGNMKLSELAFVGNRDYPGGPNAYLIEESSFVPINLVCYAAYIIATWMQDGFLLYRFLVIFSSNWWLFILPSLVYLLSIITSCLLLAQLTQNGAALFSSGTVNFALIYWASSITTTLMLTFFIVGRLLLLRYKLYRALGSHHKSPYLSISAMIIESSFLYSIFALSFLILYAKNDPFQNILFPILGQVQIIAPLLIILRVARGRSITQETLKQSATLQVGIQRSTNVVEFPMSKQSVNGSTRLNTEGSLTHLKGTTGSESDASDVGRHFEAV